MPELPEVETVLRGIEPHITGHDVRTIECLRPDLRFPFPERVEERLIGEKIQTLSRRGKYILVHFSNQSMMVIHLGMSGQVKVIAPNDSYELVKHDHFVMTLDNGGRLVFHDPRRFGFILLYDAHEQDDVPYLNKMGPEPLGNHFSSDYLYTALKCRKKPLKTALLDQSIVAGLGNIYVCEALYLSCLHPEKLSGTITKRQAADLASAIVEVLKKAIDSGGSSLKDYRKADGTLGYFQHQFDVYGKEGETCRKCDAPCVTRIVQSGRSTFYCKNHQKKR